MTAWESLAAGPWGSALAIAAMAAVTYLCRVAGVVVMSRMRITPRMERGLRALPGSIIMATILPVAIQSGGAAILGLGVTILTMALTRIDLLALSAGLGSVALFRALGL